MHEAISLEQMKKQAVRCIACKIRCVAKPGGAGVYGVRQNKEGSPVQAGQFLNRASPKNCLLYSLAGSFSSYPICIINEREFISSHSSAILPSFIL